MRKLITLASALAVLSAAALSVATPAAAAPDPDLLFRSRDASNVTASAANQPYWQLLSECAGMFGAASQWERGRGNGDASDEDKAIGARFLTEAIGQLKADHKELSDQDALALASDHVSVGHKEGVTVVGNGDIGAGSQWNWKSSACTQIEDTYHHDARRRRS
jgi:hypothetical protein